MEKSYGSILNTEEMYDVEIGNEKWEWHVRMSMWEINYRETRGVSNMVSVQRD